jgi:hypothetical protein
LLRYLRKEEAMELDTRLKLAGSKKGFAGLNNILAEEELEMAEPVDTNEASPENVKLLDTITDIVQKGR